MGDTIVRRVQSLFIALVVLGISAGAVFAGRALSDAANAGLDKAQAASDQALPAAGAADERRPDTETTTTAPATTEDESSTETQGEHPDNHGADVSAAAHLSYDELKAACTGFDGKNKGGYISAIARGELVITLTPPVAPATTPTIACGPAPTTEGATTTQTTTTTAPTKLHGKENAAAKRALHQDPTR